MVRQGVWGPKVVLLCPTYAPSLQDLLRLAPWWVWYVSNYFCRNLQAHIHSGDFAFTLDQ